MSSIEQPTEKAVATPTHKVVDLQRDIVQPEELQEQPLTTDHGVKVADTDNW
jgi:catalase